MGNTSVFEKNWQEKMMKFGDKITWEENGKLKLLLYFFLQTE
jgi:hypothetical protein